MSTIVQTASHSTRFPIVVTDPTNAWVAEGAEIPVSDPDLDELVVTPRGLKGLTVVSNELMADSDPCSLDVVGDGLVRDLRTKPDAAFFGDTVANGADGIESLANVQTTLAFSDAGNLDPFAEAAPSPKTLACSPSTRSMACPSWPSPVTPPTYWGCPPSGFGRLQPAATGTRRHASDRTQHTRDSGVQIARRDRRRHVAHPTGQGFVVLRTDPQVVDDTSA